MYFHFVFCLFYLSVVCFKSACDSRAAVSSALTGQKHRSACVRHSSNRCYDVESDVKWRADNVAGYLTLFIVCLQEARDSRAFITLTLVIRDTLAFSGLQGVALRWFNESTLIQLHWNDSLTNNINLPAFF